MGRSAHTPCYEQLDLAERTIEKLRDRIEVLSVAYSDERADRLRLQDRIIELEKRLENSNNLRVQEAESYSRRILELEDDIRRYQQQGMEMWDTWQSELAALRSQRDAMVQALVREQTENERLKREMMLDDSFAKADRK